MAIHYCPPFNDFWFFLQKAAQLPFIEILIARNSAYGKVGFNTLRGNGALTKEDQGFIELSRIYSGHLSNKAPQNTQVVRFLDTGAFVPAPGGPVNLVEVQWSNGQQADTSYEELEKIINKSFDRAIWPRQFLLFIIGVCVQIGTIAISYSPRKRIPEQENPEIH